MLKYIILLSLTFGSLASWSSVYKAAKIYIDSKGDPKKYHEIATELVGEGIYYAAIPFIKDYLVEQMEQGKTSNIDNVIDQIISEVGVKQFELLPLKILQSSNSPLARYIRAKKQFRSGKYDEALADISSGIPIDHTIKPYALLLEGSIHSIKGKFNEAYLAFDECVNSSERNLSNVTGFNKKKQLEINRDYCILGKPRTQFAAKDWEKANLSFLDLPKESYVWPEILFEEAWNSFYLKNYNRSLGKLVTYKAPVLDHVFNPENSVLTALSYMELCLWADAKQEVDSFYETYKDEAKVLKEFLIRYSKDYKYFYQIARQREDGQIQGTVLLNKLLNSIIYDPTYNELLDSFIKGKNEIVYLKKLKLGRFTRLTKRFSWKICKEITCS
jgi:hypothetical protein